MRVIESPLGQDEVLERLAAFGKDWRESRLPESVRRRQIYECVIVVSGRTLTIKVGGGFRARRYFVWLGEVRTKEGGGSAVYLDWQFSPFGWVMCALPLIAYLWARWTHGDDAMSYGLLVGVVVGATIAWEMAMQGSACEEILDHVIGMQSAASIT